MLSRICAVVLVALCVVPFTQPFAAVNVSDCGPSRPTTQATTSIATQAVSAVQNDVAMSSDRTRRSTPPLSAVADMTCGGVVVRPAPFHVLTTASAAVFDAPLTAVLRL